MQKLEDYMCKEAIETNENIMGDEDHDEVYIPGAGRLWKLNHGDLRKFNQEANSDTR